MAKTLPYAGRVATEPSAPPRSWQDIPVLLAFLAVVAGAVALALLAVPQSPGDDSPEVGFARDMSVHHARAVEMALIARDRTQDPDVRALATDVALTQQAQIGQLQGWLDVWRLPATGREPAMTWMGRPVNGLMPGMASPEQVAQLTQLPPDAVEVQLLRLMIPHHQAGVAMGQAVLDRTSRPEVRRLAEAIVASQQTEIAGMQELLQRKGQPPVESAPPMAAGMEMDDGAMDPSEGFTASVPAVARDTLRLGPLVLAIFALSWLGLDAARRRRASGIAVPVAGAAARAWQAIAVSGLAASALLHIGLAPEHFAESVPYGVFFVIAAVVLAVAAATVLAWPSRPVILASALLSGVLIALYLLFRVVPPPGAEAAEEIDLVGLVTKLTELAALVACFVLLARTGRARLNAPGAA